MTDDVHFVAVNYRGSAGLAAYLASLRGQTSTSWRMTIVDNSEDPQETERLIRCAGPGGPVRVVPAPKNLGYFGAADWLLSRPGGRRATWTVISNMDLHLGDASFVTHLLDLDPRTSVAAPSVVSMPDGRQQNPYLATRPSAGAMNRRRLMLSNPVAVQAVLFAGEVKLRLRRPDASGPAGNGSAGNGPAGSGAETRRQVYAPHGSIIPIHERYFAEGGNLSHPVFLFNEEITVAEQCHRLGLTVMFEPTLKVIHHKHQSTGLLRSWRVLRAHVDAADYGYRAIAGGAAGALHR